MITELFGEEALQKSVDEIKSLIRGLPPTQKERKSYLLHDWAAATGTELTADDFLEVEE